MDQISIIQVDYDDLEFLGNLEVQLQLFPENADLKIKLFAGKGSEEDREKSKEILDNIDDFFAKLYAWLKVTYGADNSFSKMCLDIDFEPEIFGLRISTNDQKIIQSSWSKGVRRTNSLFRDIKLETSLRVRKSRKLAIDTTQNEIKMPKQFATEIRKSPKEDYLKVFLRNQDEIINIQLLLQGLNSTRGVNITQSSSKSHPGSTLTIYKSAVYEIDEVLAEVELAINSYFEGSPMDPDFKVEGLSSISDKAYNQIIDYIYLLGTGLEKSKDLCKNFDEERSRDYFIPFLNAISKKHSATGEAFNKIGKTDILIQDDDGKNVFIAECKVWRGQEQLSQAIDQLLDRYVTWRDERVALIVFNKSVDKFSELITKATEVMESHPKYKSTDGNRHETSISYTFKHPEDEGRTIQIELILFNFK